MTTKSKAERRRRNRASTAYLKTVVQHMDDRHPTRRSDSASAHTFMPDRPTRATYGPMFTTHRSEGILTIGYGLALVPQKGKGIGLKVTQLVTKGTVFTQYEGMLMTKDEALTKGKQDATHFCTTHCRQIVIDGWKLTDRELPDKPSALCLQRLVGFGGGSFANHSPTPNASLLRSPEGDGYGVYLKALEDISPRDWVMLDYGTGFLKSSKSNL